MSTCFAARIDPFGQGFILIEEGAVEKYVGHIFVTRKIKRLQPVSMKLLLKRTHRLRAVPAEIGEVLIVEKADISRV